MEILYFDELASTQQYLIEAIKEGSLQAPIAVVAKKQPKGIGSRNNVWIAKEGDLTFSFAITKEQLPDDLPVSSASIYFGFLIKEILQEYNKDIFLKWPNDIYKNGKKMGGVVTYFRKNIFIVGIGINLVRRNDGFSFLELEDAHKSILEPYFLLLKKAPSWQEIFNKFRVEFKKSSHFSVHTKKGLTTLHNAVLCEDGSLLINDERIYSLR